jgi:hypothetical protein
MMDPSIEMPAALLAPKGMNCKPHLPLRSIATPSAPKYSENRAFGLIGGDYRRQNECYFKRLHIKFATWRISEIFRAINE